MHGIDCRQSKALHTPSKTTVRPPRAVPRTVCWFLHLFLFLSLFSTTAMIINFTASFTGRIEAKHMAKSKISCHRTLLDYPLGDGALKVGNIFLMTHCSILIFGAPCEVHLCLTMLICKLHFPKLSCVNRPRWKSVSRGVLAACSAARFGVSRARGNAATGWEEMSAMVDVGYHRVWLRLVLSHLFALHVRPTAREDRFSLAVSLVQQLVELP